MYVRQLMKTNKSVSSSTNEGRPQTFKAFQLKYLHAPKYVECMFYLIGAASFNDSLFIFRIQYKF